MTADTQEKKETTTTNPVEPQKSSSSKKEGGESGARQPFRKNPRKFVRRERVKSEYDQKIISIRRVTRVVSGGRRFSFSVAVIIGNRKGKVGVGVGKASDTSLAIEKSVRDARKNIVQLKLTEEMSIPHDVKAKYNASIVEIRPAPGRGISAGSSVYNVLEMSGVKDVSAKLLSRSKNKLNNAQATIKALSTFKTS